MASFCSRRHPNTPQGIAGVRDDRENVSVLGWPLGLYGSRSLPDGLSLTTLNETKVERNLNQHIKLPEHVSRRAWGSQIRVLEAAGLVRLKKAGREERLCGDPYPEVWLLLGGLKMSLNGLSPPPAFWGPSPPSLASPSDLSGYDLLVGDVSSLQVNFKGLPRHVPTGQLLQGLL